jgi:hypothetical protein
LADGGHWLREERPRAAIATPYCVTMLLEQFVGSKGIEIVGASRSIRRGVPKS